MEMVTVSSLMLKLIFIHDSNANLSIVNNSSVLNIYKKFKKPLLCKLADSNKLFMGLDQCPSVHQGEINGTEGHHFR